MSIAPTSTAKLWSTSPTVWRIAAFTVMFVSWWWSPWWEWTFNKQIILRVKKQSSQMFSTNTSCTNWVLWRSNLVHQWKASLCYSKIRMQVGLSHDLVLSSCTSAQEPILKTKQYTTANQWLLNKKNRNGYFPVHQYTGTQPMFWQQRKYDVHVSLDMFSWHFDVFVV